MSRGALRLISLILAVGLWTGGCVIDPVPTPGRGGESTGGGGVQLSDDVTNAPPDDKHEDAGAWCGCEDVMISGAGCPCFEGCDCDGSEDADTSCCEPSCCPDACGPDDDVIDEVDGLDEVDEVDEETEDGSEPPETDFPEDVG